MKIVFTICSNNYLAAAKVLYNSVKEHCPQVDFYLFLCDEKNEKINYASFAREVFLLREIEKQFYDFAARYNIVELNTCMKPKAFEFLFVKYPEAEIIYLDPDIYVYSSLEPVFDELQNASMLLTPHILSPIAYDGKTPSENHFLNFGIYNLGFLGLKRNKIIADFLTWWKGHTYKQCYVDVYKGIFVDQLPVNFAPVFYEEVKILKWPGLNMAPWNLHERKEAFLNETIVVNGNTPLLFFHFSSFKPGLLELPLEQYNRYRLEDRPVLHSMYQEYGKKLSEAGDSFYKKIPYSYEMIRKYYLKNKKKEKWLRKILMKKGSKK